MGDVAERPEPFVGETVVIASLFLGGQPDATDLVSGIFRRYSDAVMLIDYLFVGRAAAVGDPGALAGAHDRLQRRDQPAGRLLYLDVIAAVLVNIGFAVGNDDHVFAAQFAVKNGAQ